MSVFKIGTMVHKSEKFTMINDFWQSLSTPAEICFPTTSIDVRFKLKLLIHTYRCTHALASSLLCQQYKLRSPSNSTHSTTRSQLTLSLCIPSAARRPGTISPLFTSTLLWNSLPSPTRSASSLHTFKQDLQKYLGIPVIRPR